MSKDYEFLLNLFNKAIRFSYNPSRIKRGSDYFIAQTQDGKVIDKRNKNNTSKWHLCYV